MREVIARTAIKPHARSALARDDAKALVFNLVQPLAAGGKFVGFGWETRRDESGRQGTLQHIDRIRSGNSQLTGDGLAAIQG